MVMKPNGKMVAHLPAVSYSQAPQGRWTGGSLRPLLRRLRRHHRHEGAATLGNIKTNRATDLGKYRVIAAHAHTVARMHCRATLADEDVAGDDGLAAEFLHAKTAAGGVATVAG